MVYYLQMTYIPSLDEQGKFFLWLTDEEGLPEVSKHKNLLFNLLSEHEWASLLLLQESRNINTVLEYEDNLQEVEGLLVPMWPLFHLLQEDMDHATHNGTLHLGEAFIYWRKIVKCVTVLLQQGHYYPTLIAIDKEDHYYAFAQWMLKRHTLHSLDLFNDWIRSMPSLIISAVELAPLSIKQWLDVLLDTWVDQTIRNIIHPTQVAPNLIINTQSNIDQDIVSKWFNHLFNKENTCFIVTNKHSERQKVEQLRQQIERWHQSLVPTGYLNPNRTLATFKSAHFQSTIEPLTLILSFEPMDEANPFSEWFNWKVTLKVEAVIEGQQQIYASEEIWTKSLYAKTWLEEMVDKLILLDDSFYPLTHTIFRGDFFLEWSAINVSRFYHKHKDMLTSLNIQLQFPTWIHLKSWLDNKVDVQLETAVNQGSKFNLASLVNFKWQISVGEVSLPVSQFTELVEEQQRFLQHQGAWIELPLEQMISAYDEMRDIDSKLGKQGRMSDLLYLSISEKRNKRKHLDIHIDHQADQYLKNILEKPTKSLAVPAQFQGLLRHYQHVGFTWLCTLREKGIGGCLADDMGLGKTIQTIAYLLEMPRDDHANPTLIICPTSLIGNWKRELSQFSPSLNIYAHHGPDRFGQEQFKKNKTKFDVMITSYALVLRDAKLLLTYKWASLILDEAQAIKNPATKQSQLVRRLSADHRIALTGTPMENRLEELWSIMDFLNPGYLGSLRGFRSQFITPIEKHQNHGKSKLLQQLIQPFLLRRAKTDRSVINDLPDKFEKKELCFLTAEQASLYQTVVDELMRKMSNSSGIERKGLILAALTRLKQVCNHPALVLEDAQLHHSGKLMRFFEIIQPLLNQGQSALVFTQYVRMGHLLRRYIQQRFAECPIFFLHGGLSSIKREEIIQHYRQYKDQKAIFILSLKAGGLGLNLTEANHVIHYDRWWNPAVEDQATDRAYRIGQQKNVHVYKLVNEGTLEEGIDQLIEQKKELTEQIIGQGDGWVTELTDEEIYQLIRLREGVIS